MKSDKLKILLKKLLPGWLARLIKLGLSARRLWLARKHGVYAGRFTSKNGKIRVLFYELSGMSYAGTQKSLQILAKHLDKEKFEVYYMYSQLKNVSRLPYMQDSGARLVPFVHAGVGGDFPFYVGNMRPHIFELIEKEKINLIVAPGSGYPEYPIANITETPIIQINVFGSINHQRNIKKYICISQYLNNRLAEVLKGRDVKTFYIQSEGPDALSSARGRELRTRLGLTDEDFLFGRIGRPDDNIFDPIALEAFSRTVGKGRNMHYLIMAPPPKAVALVKSKDIPNVHFLPPTGEEGSIWAFHMAIDALAHFRYDGETMGLNIAESMLCGKPIITHVSPIWNAHLEYLEPSFSRVAKEGDVGQYAEFLSEFAGMDKAQLVAMGEAARSKAEKLFLIKNNIAEFEKIITDAANA